MKDMLSNISNKQFKYLKKDNSLFLMGREDHRPNHYENLRTNRKQGNKNMTGAGAPCNNENKQGKWRACINGVVREGPPWRGDIKQRPEDTIILKAGRVLHREGRACAKALRRKGNLETKRAHTDNKSWTKDSILLPTPVPYSCILFNQPLSWYWASFIFQFSLSSFPYGVVDSVNIAYKFFYSWWQKNKWSLTFPHDILSNI